MTVIPFVCLGIGIVIGVLQKSDAVLNAGEKISTLALVALMIAIGVSIGVDEDIVKQFPRIGMNCIIIALCAIFASVIVVTLFEKTVMPLQHYKSELADEAGPGEDVDEIIGEGIGKSNGESEGAEEGGVSNLVWIMPLSVVIGVVAGILFKVHVNPGIVDMVFTGSLIVLYICVGIGQGANKKVIPYLKKLGFKILLLPLGICIGSIGGGLVAAAVCDVPMKIAVISAGGMSFYSITGAYMTQTYGLAMGIYGFIVNVLREVFTIILMPLLIRIGYAAPIAGGAAGDMDTMLAPITKFVGQELGLVTLLTGTGLTFVVPLALPVFTLVLG